MKKAVLAIMMAMAMAFAASAATKAEFAGGDKALTEYIAKNLKYPEMAKENGVEGVVTVMFTVKPDGSIGNIKIKRMVDPDLEQESIRLVKTMPKWTPATDDAGNAVESTAEVSIPFTLE